MRIILDNFFQLSAQNAEGVVVWALLAIYAGLLLTSLLDIMTRKREFRFKLAWNLLVVLLPFIGMALYSILSLCTAEYPLLNQLGFNSKSNQQKTKKTHKSRST